MTLYLQLLFDGVVNGCAIGLVSISFAYFYASTGIFHVAHAGIYTVGGYVALYLTAIGLPFVPALLLAMLCCVLVGLVTQLLLYRKLEERRASPLVMMIASIGLLTLLQNIVAILFTPNILQFDLPWRLKSIMLGSVALSYPQAMIGAASLVIFGGMLAFSRYSSLGKRIRAVASNPELAEITRLKPKAVFLYVIAISSAIVAVPGVLVGVDQALQPYTALLPLLTAIVAMIAGGIGSLPGAFLMSILISVVQSMSVAFVSGRWSIAVVFGVFVLLILLKPEGLFRSRFARAL